MKKLSVTYICLFGLLFIAGAQQSGLKLGEELPSFQIPQIINDAQPSINTSAYKDKLLIIDFWSTTCSGCVAALPHMQQLQQQFGEKIKILPVTYEPESLIREFWKTNKYLKTLKIASVVNDSVFHSLFPRRAIPHEVWVRNGKVIGITEPEYVDEKNISDVLSGKIPNWPLKDDYYAFDAANTRLFMPDGRQIDTLTSQMEYAAISGYREKNGASDAGVYGNAGIIRDSVHGTIRYYNVNVPIFNIYYSQWAQLISFSKIKPGWSANMIRWEVLDKSKYSPKNPYNPDIATDYIHDWKREHAICFESQYKDVGQTDAEVAANVIRDLDRLLGLRVRFEDRKEKVWVLKMKSVKGVKIPSSPTDIRLADVSFEMNRQPSNRVVFDETGKREMMVNVQVKSWTDVLAIKAALAKYGVEMVEEERVIKKFVFTEVGVGLVPDAALVAEGQKIMAGQSFVDTPDSEQGRALLEKNKNEPGVVILPSGLQYKILKAGSGTRPAAGDMVWINYTGRLSNGKVYETSLTTGLPVSFYIKGELLQGVQEALKLMPVGSKWKLYMPAELAYKNHTNYGRVPRNSVIVYEIELVKINEKDL